MEADDWLAATLVEVVKAQTIDVCVVGLEAVPGKIREALVGCAEYVHAGASLAQQRRRLRASTEELARQRAARTMPWTATGLSSTTSIGVDRRTGHP